MKYLFICTLIAIIVITHQKAPFVPINTVHHAHSEFQVNLILNENRNYPIIMLSYSADQLKQTLNNILTGALAGAKYAGFALLIDCKQFAQDMNKTVGICLNYDPKVLISQDNDLNLRCDVMIPEQTRIKDKGHYLRKNHLSESLDDAAMLNSEYLADKMRKGVPDFVTDIEDQYDLAEFLNQNPEFLSSKQPKVLYFDENLLAPLYLKKFACLADGKLTVGVTDDPSLFRQEGGTEGQAVVYQYNFTEWKYARRVISIEEDNQIESLLEDKLIQVYLEVKKIRDIMLDFEHSNFPVYNYSQLRQVQNLNTHGRILIVEFSQQFQCEAIQKVVNEFSTFFNYVCFGGMTQDEAMHLFQVEKDSKYRDNLLMIVNDFSKAKWVPKDNNIKQLYDKLPKASSRQPVSTITDSDHCIRTAKLSNRSPIFYYFNEKTNQRSLQIMSYLNSMPQVTSLLYFCQIYLPDSELADKFDLKPNIMFTLYDPDSRGNIKKMQHLKIKNFLEIKMFLREICIQKMHQVYEQRLIQNKLDQLHTNKDMNQLCFKKNCIIGLIATGKYRQGQELRMLKQFKMEYEELYNFAWIDGICHWDVPRQLKILKKKQKVIKQSYIFLYNAKNNAYSLWQGGKFWNSKGLNKWIKSLRISKIIRHLKFGIDIEERVCKAVSDRSAKDKDKDSDSQNQDL